MITPPQEIIAAFEKTNPNLDAKRFEFEDETFEGSQTYKEDDNK